MRKNEADNFVRVKLALGDKCERKARTCKSKSGKSALFRQAERFRRQAEDARRTM
jgi:hypothetical protein